MSNPTNQHWINCEFPQPHCIHKIISNSINQKLKTSNPELDWTSNTSPASPADAGHPCRCIADPPCRGWPAHCVACCRGSGHVAGGGPGDPDGRLGWEEVGCTPSLDGGISMRYDGLSFYHVLPHVTKHIQTCVLPKSYYRDSTDTKIEQDHLQETSETSGYNGITYGINLVNRYNFLLIIHLPKPKLYFTHDY
jgi:hypothetical protein